MGRFRALSAEERLVRNTEGFREGAVGGVKRSHPGKLVTVLNDYKFDQNDLESTEEVRSPDIVFY